MDRKEKIKNFKKSQNPDKPKKKIALKIEKTEKPEKSISGDLIGGGILITIAAFIFKAALKGSQK